MIPEPMGARSFRRVFVMGAYLPNGGAAMAYHLGRILHEDFGLEAVAVAVGEEHPDRGVRPYQLRMPIVSREDMERTIGDDDVLLVNAGFSRHLFGWRIPGFKIGYVQGFAEFMVLDLRLDHLVAVSEPVAAYVKAVYGVTVGIIPPFIEVPHADGFPAWRERPSNVVQPYLKGHHEIWMESFARLRTLVAARAPEIVFADPIQGGMLQTDLWSRVAGARYLLTLSALEGFGLVPLEAMALGTVVVGYDGVGGRHYMRPRENCMVAPFAQIERVADLLVEIVRDGRGAELMAARARATAGAFTYGKFRTAWVAEFRAALGGSPHGAEARR